MKRSASKSFVEHAAVAGLPLPAGLGCGFGVDWWSVERGRIGSGAGWRRANACTGLQGREVLPELVDSSG